LQRDCAGLWDFVPGCGKITLKSEVAAVVIELSDELEASVKAQARARGLPPDLYVREVLERGLQSAAASTPKLPLETGYGMWAEYGVNISDEDIAENRADMFRNFGEDF
jgi:hypothetical protein